MTEKRVFPSPPLADTPLKVWLLAALLALALTSTGCRRASAPALVECVLDYGGQARTTVVRATTDPYRVKPVNVDDQFAFRAVYVTAPAAAAVLDLYTYYVTEKGPVIVEQTKYLPPFPKNSAALRGSFTGLRGGA